MLAIELRQMMNFVAVAEELHFGRAASRMHIAQSALSEQIKQLEQTLGVNLLSRTTRSVRLTLAGRMFLGQARLILMQVEIAVDLVRLSGRAGLGLEQSDSSCGTGTTDLSRIPNND